MPMRSLQASGGGLYLPLVPAPPRQPSYQNIPFPSLHTEGT